MVDEAGDVARGHLQLIGQFPEGQLAFGCGLERPQDVEAALTQAMLVGPAIHEPVSQPGGDAQRRHSLHRAHLLFRQRPARRPERVAEAAVVQASGSIAGQRAVEATVALDIGELHSEVLHYPAWMAICQMASSGRFTSGAAFADVARRSPWCAARNQQSVPAALPNNGAVPRWSPCAAGQKSA